MANTGSHLFFPSYNFHNDITPRYDAAAAKHASSRTIEFFNKKLS